MFAPAGTNIIPTGTYALPGCMVVYLNKNQISNVMQTNNKEQRQYYVDWVRILLILTVFVFHIGMVFNAFEWHVKNDQQYSFLSPVMSFLHLWRMPLLFLISGVGTHFALKKRNVWQYIRERSLRLLLPLTAGIFILVPVQVYIERIDHYESLLHYYPHMFEGIYPEGNFSWHHLWFIAYLWFISMAISPFLKRLRGGWYHKISGRIRKLCLRPLGMNVVLAPLMVSQLLLKPYFPNETHDLVNDWAFISYNAIFFLAGLVLFVRPSVREAVTRYRRWYMAEAVLTSLLWFSALTTQHTHPWMHLMLSIAVAWSCGIAAMGYAARYLNRDSRYRKLANEAIYHFYLLHQPLIIIFAWPILQWDLPAWIKALLIASSSFLSSVGLYWYAVRPFRIARLLFGMKVQPGHVYPLLPRGKLYHALPTEKPSQHCQRRETKGSQRPHRKANTSFRGGSCEPVNKTGII